MTQTSMTLTRNRTRLRVVLGSACLLAFLAPACSDSDDTGGVDATVAEGAVGTPPQDEQLDNLFGQSTTIALFGTVDGQTFLPVAADYLRFAVLVRR